MAARTEHERSTDSEMREEHLPELAVELLFAVEKAESDVSQRQPHHLRAVFVRRNEGHKAWF